ncbi:CHASE3 domain-containing protein [Fulvivirgaceae bacterium PWU4]|uniref:histidine kinase n=1 Tax=Chryseosolibacter histidini TaxID=2782349 RepID=A0AAP2DNH7_9BACT|nr:ATP-binding protein [Chryseosolibacter histidini]MBT1697304.1 CHASE3 domain-containing protein [Chryseosolibacter histidini]
MKITQASRLQLAGLYFLLVLSVLLSIASAYITNYNTREKKESTEMIVRRYQSIESAVKLLSLVKDMESGQRGYIISGDRDFLIPYEGNKTAMDHEVDTLKQLILDNERQSNLLTGQIIDVLQNKSEELENGIDIYNAYGKDSASRRVTTKIGLAHMDTLRILVQDLVQRERALLADQEEKLERNTNIEDNVRFLAFMLIGLTSVAAMVTLIRKQRAIRQLIENLQNANEALEAKVQERTRELIEANRAKDHFLSIASHDLKVPISGIYGLIELLSLQPANRSAQEKEYLDYIKESCINMQRLISNLLDVNRLGRGGFFISTGNTNIGSMLEKLRVDFVNRAQSKGITLTVESPDVVLDTDADALTRILENLLSNAIKFSSAGTKVYLRVSEMEDQVRFDVIDHGPGIPDEDLPLLFGRFQRLTNKPTGGEGSTGLGLSIVKDLADLLGGEIRVTSEVGKGTTFSITIGSVVKEAAPIKEKQKSSSR